MKSYAARFIAAAAFAACLAPAAAFAEGGHGGFDPWIHGLYIFDFLVVVVPLILIAGPRLKRYLAGRYDEIRADIDEAKKGFEDAKARLDAGEKRLQNITAEIDALMAEFKSLGEKERDSLAHEGAVLAEKIRDEMDFRWSQAVKMARMELREAVVARSIGQVEQRLAARSDRAVSEELVDGFAAGIGKA